MSDCKTFVFPDAAMCGGGNKGLEGAVLGSMMGGGNMNGGMWNNPIWAIVFLAALRNGGIFGNDNNGSNQLDAIQAQLASNQNSSLLMDAIKGNASSVHELATSLNCDINAVQQAINSVQASICQIGNQVGMSSAQIVNAIQAGNMQLANTLQSCCCDIRQEVTKMGYESQINNLQQSQLIQQNFAQQGYQAAEQTCSIKQAIADQTKSVIAVLDQQESSRKDREITALTAQLTAASARAERQAELAPLYAAVDSLKCKLPDTVTLPYSCATAVPTAAIYAAAASGLCGGLTGIYGQRSGQIWS